MNALNPRVVAVIAKRQLAGYLTNPLGYLIILVFVVFSGFLLFWRDEFFERNIADLALLYDTMPAALAVLLPLLAMSSWSAEREQGTDELLLTMPVTIADAVAGKFVAIVGFFTLALLFTLSNVLALVVLGEPDLGLILANYLGWWLLGLGFAGFALLGSVLVRNQVIAFVLGTVFCGSLMAGGQYLGWSEPFGRGLLPAGAVLTAVAITAVGLGLCVLVLAARRWRSQLAVRIGGQLLAVVLGVVVCVQVGRIAYRWNADMDLSVDGIASISAASEEVVGKLEKPVRLTLVITADENLSEGLRLRAERIINRAKALERAAGGHLHLVDILRPTYAVDEAGVRAEQDFGLDTRQVVIDTVAGPQTVNVFLGAHMSCGTETVEIPYFEPGMNPEYELVRGLRSVSARATEPEPAQVRLTLAVPTDPHPSIAGKVDAATAAVEGLTAKDERLEVEWLRVAEVNSEAGDRAKAVGLSVRRIEPGAIDTPGAEDDGDGEDADAAASQPVRTIFGAVAESGRYRRSRAYLGEAGDAGQAVEDMVADLRDMTDKRLPVLGVLKTDLQVNGGFAGMPPMGEQMPRRDPPWEIIGELELYYRIRDIAPGELNDETNQDVDVLLALLPSSLTVEQMPELMRYIWEGRPTLLMVDPLPILPLRTEGKNLAPAAPKPDPMAQYRRGQQQPDVPDKGNLVPLLDALGVRMRLQEIAWYNYIPGRNLAPISKELRCAWLMGDQGCIAEDQAVTEGIDSLLMFAPGVFYENIAGKTEVEMDPLVWIDRNERWGVHAYSELIQEVPPQFGGAIIRPDMVFAESNDTQRPLVAARITGPLVYNYEDGFVAPGTSSKDPCEVILLADTDLIHNAIYGLYLDRYGDRDGDRSEDQDDREVLRNLRNIQFVSNCIDWLAGDTSLLAIRSRHGSRRALTQIDRFVVDARNRREKTVEETATKIEKAIAKAREDFNRRIDDMIATRRSEGGWDERALQQQRRAQVNAGQARLERQIRRLNRDKEKTNKEADRELRRVIAGRHLMVRILVVVIPTVLLLLIMTMAMVNKLVRERTDIPANRKRKL